MEDYLEINNSRQDACFDYIDLRGIPCPLNFIRCNLAVENLKQNQTLKAYVDIGEPEESILSALSKAGYIVQVINKNEEYSTLKIKYFDR